VLVDEPLFGAMTRFLVRDEHELNVRRTPGDELRQSFVMYKPSAQLDGETDVQELVASPD